MSPWNVIEVICAKKQCLLSSGKLCVNGTVDAGIASLEPPVMPSDSTCSVNHGLQAPNHEESDIGKQSCKCYKQSTSVPPISNTSSKLMANVNYSNGHPIDEQNNSINANIRCMSVARNVASNITSNVNDATTSKHLQKHMVKVKYICIVPNNGILFMQRYTLIIAIANTLYIGEFPSDGSLVGLENLEKSCLFLIF
ncbi:hypothetical protein Tco_0527157 [Tanacetum coccineum]